MGLPALVEKFIAVAVVGALLIVGCAVPVVFMSLMVRMVAGVAELLGFGKSNVGRKLTDREAEVLARLAAEDAIDFVNATGARPVFVDATGIRAAGTAIQADADLGAVGVPLGRQRLDLLRRVGVLHVDGEDG